MSIIAQGNEKSDELVSNHWKAVTQSSIKIARINHWVKNLFMLPGVIIGIVLTHGHVSISLLVNVIVGFLALCIMTSANYTINEYLDSEFDKLHPLKKNRPGALGLLNKRIVFVQYILLIILSLFLSSRINFSFLSVNFMFMLMGIIYNVKPLRSKDRVYLDVLSESINNPLRLLYGWTIVLQTVLPPSSILISYWMGGAFLMSVKRLSEYRMIKNPILAANYRKSFKYYDENKLLVSSFFYALNSVFFLGIFLIRYRVEFIFSFPLFSVLFMWYLHLGLKKNSIAQAPECLIYEYNFLWYIGVIILVCVFLTMVDIPFLHVPALIFFNY